MDTPGDVFFLASHVMVTGLIVSSGLATTGILPNVNGRLASILKRLTLPDSSGVSLAWILSKIASVSGIFFEVWL
jgi:hypothetical protein